MTEDFGYLRQQTPGLIVQRQLQLLIFALMETVHGILPSDPCNDQST